MIFAAPFRRKTFPTRLCAIAGLAAIAALSACAPPKPPPLPVVVAPPPPPAANPLNREQPNFLRLPNMGPNTTPVRVGIILPFSSGTQATRTLATAMLKSAELALFDSGNRNLLLMTADEGTPDQAGAAARKLLGQGAEIIVGPLFGPSVATVAPIARDRGVPVLAFSTERSVAGNGVYLLSFLPQNEVRRIVSFASSQGKRNFAAMVPQTAYGEVVANAFNDAVKSAGATNVDVERFTPDSSAVMAPSATIAKSNADAVLLAQGGGVLRAIAPSLAFNGLDPAKVKLLGTGLWDDPALTREQTLQGGWFAAPEPDADGAFTGKYKTIYGSEPPQLASLAYDAISLVALLSKGQPYRRFTPAALMDPNGFSGVDGIFRFNADGTSERGLAILEVQPDGFHVVNPAPKTFQARSF
ncbi:MAG TPA: penicillin-binding protein activator [Rhizomicrobium sp.]|nr:penicillin-binding protein activator [Rhizomicrobium sp.]